MADMNQIRSGQEAIQRLLAANRGKLAPIPDYPDDEPRSRTQPTPSDTDEPPISPTLPFVESFAQSMEANFARDRVQGDLDSWRADRPYQTFLRLLKQTKDLAGFLGIEYTFYVHDPVTDESYSTISPDAVEEKCADLANCAMVLADSYRQRYFA